MGESLKHLRGLKPGHAHHIESGGQARGTGAEPAASEHTQALPERSNRSPHLPAGEARGKGNAIGSGGERANVAPSMKPDGMGPTLTK